MAKLGSGVTMIEVSNFLGYYSNPIQLSKLVKHPNIPRWSRCKPINHVGTLPAGKEEFEAVMDNAFWGFEPDVVEHLNTDEEMFGSALTLSKGEVWHYSGVTASPDTPARLADFRWCNSDAACPFLPVGFDTDIEPGIAGHRGPRFKFVWSRNLSPNVEINPYNNDFLKNKDAYIVYRKQGELTANSAASATVTSEFTTMSSSTVQLLSSQTGTYEACTVIYRKNAGEIYPLPNTYITFETRNMSEEEYAGLSLTNRCSLRVSSRTGWLTVCLQVRNLTNEAIAAVVGCDIYDYRGERLWRNLNYSVNIPAGGLLVLYGDENESFTTTNVGEFKLNDTVGAGEGFRPPITADCFAKNTLGGHSEITITKTTTILDS